MQHVEERRFVQTCILMVVLSARGDGSKYLNNVCVHFFLGQIGLGLKTLLKSTSYTGDIFIDVQISNVRSEICIFEQFLFLNTAVLLIKIYSGRSFMPFAVTLCKPGGTPRDVNNVLHQKQPLNEQLFGFRRVKTCAYYTQTK